MKKTIIKLIGSLLIFSCSQKEQVDITVVRQEQNIESTPKEIRFKDLFCVEQLFLKDSLMLLVDRCDSCLFHLYDVEKDSLLYSFGSKGQGPGDFLYPFFFAGTANAQDSVYCYDINLRMLKSFSWDAVCSGNVSAVNNTMMPKSLIGSPDVTKIGKEYWGTLDHINKGLYFKYKEEQDSSVWIPYPKDMLNDSEGIGLQARIGVNPISKAVVVGMKYYNKLFLYDDGGDLCREVRLGADVIAPDMDKKTGEDNNVLCCQHIQVTEQSIYVLESGWPKSEMMNEAFTSRILVFDWNLNYQRTYLLPHKAICFAVDEKSNRLVYTGLNGEDSMVGVIQL